MLSEKRRTLSNFALGVIVGPAFACVVAVAIFASFICVAFIPLLLPLGLLLCLIGLAVSQYLVFAICRDKDKEYTSGAKSFAIGLCVGNLIACCVLASQSERWPAIGAFVFGFLCLAFGFLGATHHARTFLGRVRPGIGRMCFACRYDLASIPEHLPCPECGGLMRYEFRNPQEYQSNVDQAETADRVPRRREGE
jgi:hypothetical protein